jgi:branched-subunit amino acid ABC-type transport system permease component
MKQTPILVPASTFFNLRYYLKEDSMEQILASLADGLLLGFVYGLAAMGLTLIFGVMDVINLGHGPIIALGMFAIFFISSGGAGLGLHPYVALPVVAILGLLFGIVMYFVAVHRVLDAPHLSSLLATFSVNMMIIGIGTAFFTTSPRNLEFSVGSVQIGSVTLLGTRLVAALIALLVTAGLYLFLYRTPPGKAIRAVANNRAAAELMGVPSTQTLALSFGIGTMLAAVSGGLIATFFSFSILSGTVYELKSFVIVVLGGLGNPTGALIGGLILGALEGIVPVFMPVSWVPVIEFVLFVLILLVRPTGLMGGR